MTRSLLKPGSVKDIHERIAQVTENSPRRWGSMDSAQMFCHCDRILQVALGKIVLPPPNIIFKTVGVSTKYLMKFLDIGIPANMPTFKAVQLKESCNFERSKEDFLCTFDDFLTTLEEGSLIAEHALFGRMSKQDWGLLQYKHINHHLNQFGV